MSHAATDAIQLLFAVSFGTQVSYKGIELQGRVNVVLGAYAAESTP